jgi:hypothetical protein
MGWFRDIGRDRPWIQGCIVAAAGAVLALGSCFGLLFSTSFNTGNSTVGEWFGFLLMGLMFLFALAVPVGGIWFIVGLVKSANRPAPPAPPSPPPSPPPPPPSQPLP